MKKVTIALSLMLACIFLVVSASADHPPVTDTKYRIHDADVYLDSGKYVLVYESSLG